jgi:superfamily II DNA or RNA helicase
MEEVESCKQLGMRYSPEKKAWSISPGFLDDVLKELQQYSISISEYDRLKVKEYFETLSELKKTTKRTEWKAYHPELLKVSPLIPANEADYKKSFQYIDSIKFINQNRALAAWSTGTGKSFLLAAIYSHLRYYGEVKKAIILTSSIGILNLANELRKFIVDYDNDKTLVVDSIRTLKDRFIFDDQKYDIIICGYDSFRAIGDAYDKRENNRKRKVKYRKSSLPIKEWLNNSKGIIFFDECHLLGSPNSLRSKFIDMNLKFFEYRYLMSATPADKEEKMYMILKILDKKLINGLSYIDWLSTYCELGTRWSKYGINKDSWDYSKWLLLQDELYKNYAVKRGKELLNLPQAYDVPLIYVNMSTEHRQIYEAFTYEVINSAKQRNAVNRFGLMENLTNTFQYLQLAVDNPKCLENSPNFDKFDAALQKRIHSFNYEKDFSKLHALDAIIEEETVENDNKVIVFYYHPLTLECLKKHFQKNYDFVSAEQTKEERFAIIEGFKKNRNKILLASILIMNTSITLLEAKASIFYEKTYQFISYEQARGRNYRIGQQDEVRYYNIAYNNSIDNLINENLKHKGKVLEGLIKRNVLSQDEWKLLFNGEGAEFSSFTTSLLI